MKARRVFPLLLLAVFAFGQSRTRTYTIVPSESSFWVFVGKTGLFSALAHDHEIGVKSFRRASRRSCSRGQWRIAGNGS